MVSMFFWVAFGALVGWIAAILQDESKVRKISAFIGAGMLGGLAGGFGSLLLSADKVAARASTADIMFAVFGAIIFVVIAGRAAQKYFRE